MGLTISDRVLAWQPFVFGFAAGQSMIIMMEELFTNGPNWRALIQAITIVLCTNAVRWRLKADRRRNG